MITDGENHEDDAVAAAKEAYKNNITIHTIGMGSINGAPIPVYTNGQRTGFMQDKNGQTVITKIDEHTLAEIAQAGNGKFIRATNSDDGLSIIMKEINAMQKNEFGSKMFTDYADQFQYLLGVALLFLILEFLISEKRSRWMEELNLFGDGDEKSNILFLFFISMSFVALAQNEKPLVREGNKEYKNGKFDQAESSYRKAIEKNGSSVEGRYNLGNALYKQNKYDEAAGVYQNLNNEKLSTDVKAKSLYNLGNTLMKSEKYQEGANAYKEALKLSPNDKDALYNYSYALAKLKQQQQQQKQNQDNKKDQKNQQKNQQDKQQQKQDQQKQDQKKNKINKSKIRKRNKHSNRKFLKKMQNVCLKH